MSKIKLEGNATGTGTLTISAPSTNTDRSLTLPDTAGEFVTADSSGNVGIGTSSPERDLHVKGKSGDPVHFKLEGDPADYARIMFDDGTTENIGEIRYHFGDDDMRFRANSSERMRIDSSGYVFVGQTSRQYNENGVSLNPSGYSHFTASGAAPILFNRKTDDGEIIRLYHGATSIGVISTYYDDIYIGTGDTGIRFNDANDRFQPVNATTGANRDNAIDFGTPNARFDDIYATNGTIQTSDQNEKQQIASLTDTEMNVAKRLSALFKTYKWNSSVEENGDNARTHTGIIAQDMQQAFTDEGLDAGDYAMFISSTWWETSTDVPAVEADEENNIEAQEAYTRIDTFETQEEAPEGATERTRLGVRYPELFAFINAYNDQRFEALETRIEALENA